MIERICPKCRVPMNGDKCIKPNCGCATKMSSTIYWCDDCNVPIFENICPSCGNKGRYIATDMRPVFPEENVLISLILGDNPQKYQESSVWFGSGMYIIDGKKVRLSITKLNSLPLDKIHKLKEKYEAFVTKINYCFFDEYIRKFIKANADRYNFITEEAVQFVQKYREKYAIEDMMVSFSGGKDSTVTSHIVNRALGTNKVLHIFGDTTLEFPYTLEYKKRFKKNEESRGVRVLTAKNREKNFEDLCDIVGPPSRVMRWCCTVFKTGAIQKTISSAFKDKNNILSFQGIRHSESVSRSKYERESESPKISKQTVASPIIDWIDYDVWLYILTTGIDFNEAYRLGWTRVGCWCCPNNGGWSEFLAKVHMYDQYIHWHELLVNFAKKIGKPDPEEYINDHSLDPYPEPKDKSPLYINEPWLIDKSLLEYPRHREPDEKEDNIRIYVPMDLNKDAILRRLDNIIGLYGEAREDNEIEFSIDVGMIISQLEIYDQIWFVRHMPKKGEHSREAKELVTEIIARLEDIPDGCAECFPFELIDELKQEYLTDNSL